jgi:hypothetical protein
VHGNHEGILRGFGDGLGDCPGQHHLKGHLFGYGGITVVKGTEFLRFDLMIQSDQLIVLFLSFLSF